MAQSRAAKGDTKETLLAACSLVSAVCHEVPLSKSGYLKLFPSLACEIQ